MSSVWRCVIRRKCPGCAKPFGDKDVQSIYLGFDPAKDADA